MKPLLDRIAIDSKKFNNLLKKLDIKSTPLFNSLYWSNNGHYLMKQFQSWEEIVSVNKYKEFQGKMYWVYGFIPDLIKTKKKLAVKS